MKKLFVAVLFGLISLMTYSQTLDKNDFKFPKPIGYVNDFEGIFTTEQVNELNDIIKVHKKKDFKRDRNSYHFFL